MIRWNPDDYGGITEMFLSSKDVWTPPVVIGNPVEFSKLEESWMNVLYRSDGHAEITPIKTVGTSCSFYMKFWPFDKQQCHVSFFAFGYMNTKVKLSVSDEAVNTRYYVKNSEWTLLADSIVYEVDNSCDITVIRFYFKLMRQASFYMLTVILPINGIGGLTCMVFLLPSESGERVGYSITIMLSLAVFLTVTSDSLPKTADPAPMLCVYIFCSMVLCILCLVLVILNLAVYHRTDNTPISSWYKYLVRLSRWRYQRKELTVVQPLQNFHIDEGPNTVPAKTKDDTCTTGKKASHQAIGENDDLDHLTWKEVSEAIDKILFYSLVCVTYIPSVSVLIYIATASDYSTE